MVIRLGLRSTVDESLRDTSFLIFTALPKIAIIGISDYDQDSSNGSYYRNSSCHVLLAEIHVERLVRNKLGI